MVDEKTIDVDDEDEYYNTETKNRLDIISRNIIDKYNECGSIDNYTCDDIDKDSIYFIDIKNKER